MLGKLVDGVTGFSVEENSFMSCNDDLMSADNANDAAFNVALDAAGIDLELGKMCLHQSSSKDPPVYPGFPFVDVSAASDTSSAAAVVQSDKFDVCSSCVVYCSVLNSGSISYTTTWGMITEPTVLHNMAAHGAIFSFNRIDSPPQAAKKSHKAKLKCESDKLPPTNARSLRVKIPATPYSPMTTGGGRAVAGGVSKAKTPSPVTPATAPKETAANK
jgi:hypothetical protein